MAAGTAYAKRYGGGFLDLPTKTTAIDQLFLNAVETALMQLIGAAPTVDGQVAQWDNVNTRYGPALLLNKNIDAAAAIAKSKLDFTGANGIVNADVAGAAAIARSKLNFAAGLVDADIAAAAAIANSKLGIPLFTTSTLAGGPPGSPNDKDIWIATSVNGTKKRWVFQYDSAEATAFKWKYIGGSGAVGYYDVSGLNRQNSVINTWQQVTGSSSIAIARAGYYRVRFGANMGTTNSSNINLGPAISNVAVGFDSIYSTDPATVIEYHYSMKDMDMLDEGITALVASSSLFLNMATAVAVANSALSNPFFNVEPIAVS